MKAFELFEPCAAGQHAHCKGAKVSENERRGGADVVVYCECTCDHTPDAPVGVDTRELGDEASA